MSVDVGEALTRIEGIGARSIGGQNEGDLVENLRGAMLAAADSSRAWDVCRR